MVTVKVSIQGEFIDVSGAPPKFIWVGSAPELYVALVVVICAVPIKDKTEHNRAKSSEFFMQIVVIFLHLKNKI